jgi:hypothetical protein
VRPQGPNNAEIGTDLHSPLLPPVSPEVEFRDFIHLVLIALSSRAKEGQQPVRPIGIVSSTRPTPDPPPSGEEPGLISLAGAETRGDFDLVHGVPISASFAEDRATSPLMGYAGDRERVILRAAAERHGDCVTNCDPRRQIDVVIGVARVGNEPVAALGQNARAPWVDGLDAVSLLSGREITGSDEHQAHDGGSQ